MVIRLVVFFFLSLVFSCVNAKEAEPTESHRWVSTEWNGMGTRFSIEIFSSKKYDVNKLMTSAKREAVRIEQMMSSYSESSEVSLINKTGYLEPVTVSKELLMVLKKAHYYSEVTQGAFDVTYASVGYLYDLRNEIVPSQSEIDSSIKGINYRYVVIDEKLSTVSLTSKDTRIDLGGIAKGYTVDQIAKLLITSGIEHGIVTAGGDSRIIGDRNGRPWMIGIKDPRSVQYSSEHEVAVTLPLADTALSTSGDYERFFIKGGERFHHILSPASGKSARKVQSVSILAPNSIDADALSTAVFVMGVDEGVKLVESITNTEVIIIDQHRKMHFSSGLGAR